MEAFLIFFIFGSLWLIGGNYALHKFEENKKNLLLKSIKSKEYQLIKNVKLKTYSNSKHHFGYSYNVLNADVIIVENNIFILQFITRFGEKIKMCQPILQFYYDGEFLKTNGVRLIEKIDNLKLHPDTIEIYSHKFENNKLLSRDNKTLIIKNGIYNELTDSLKKQPM